MKIKRNRQRIINNESFKRNGRGRKKKQNKIV